MNDLLEYLEGALATGAIPAPVDGESMDSYRMRVAHAGSIVGMKWLTDRNAQMAAEQGHEDHAKLEVVEVEDAVDEGSS